MPSSESFTDGDLLRPIFWKPHLLEPSNGRFKYMMMMEEKREARKGGGPEGEKEEPGEVAGEDVTKLWCRDDFIAFSHQPSAISHLVPVLASDGVSGKPCCK